MKPIQVTQSSMPDFEEFSEETPVAKYIAEKVLTLPLTQI